MDDSRTQAALDSLADLFLTQAAPGKPRADPPDDAVPEPDDAQDEAPAEDPTPSPPASDAPGPSGPPDDDPLVGPSPIRLAPKLSARPTKPHEPHAPYDADPDFNPPPGDFDPPAPGPALRYTGEVDHDVDTDAPAPAATAAHDAATHDGGEDGPDVDSAPAAMVEAVMLGHLPGLAGPWLTQYAQLLADQTGPVLLIHVDEEDAPDDALGVSSAADAGLGRLDLELVEPIHPDAASRRSVRIPPPRPEQASGPDAPLGMIDAMLRARAGKVSTILIHLEAGDDPARLTRLLGIEDWTLLTGGDDLAVAGATAMLRKLADADSRAASKQVAVMVMGTELRVAEAATRKISDATDAFMHSPALNLGCHPKLGPVNVRQLGSFSGLGRLWPQLLAYLRDLELPQTPEVTEVPPPPKDAAAPAADPAAPTGSTAKREALGAMAAAGVSHAHADRAPKQTSTTTREPHSEAAWVHDNGDDESPRLAEMVAAGSHGITGGVALEARCPYQPLTELVLDEAGRLHLLRRELPVKVEGGDAEAQRHHEAGLRAAIVDLVEARKWVREHLELLKLTLRDADFDADADPAMHLFTDKAHMATPLVAKLGDQVRLHLLQQVRVGNQSTWFTTPLN